MNKTEQKKNTAIGNLPFSEETGMETLELSKRRCLSVHMAGECWSEAHTNP